MFQSLALETDLIFHRVLGEVRDHGDYVVIRTPARPDYFWGNCLIMRAPPSPGVLDSWIAAFEREIGPRAKTGFMTFTWDDPSGGIGEARPFLDFGFKLSISTVFTAKGLRRPARSTPFSVRALESEDDWVQYVDVHCSEDWDYGTLEDQRRFVKDQRDDLRALERTGLGQRFGAFQGKRLVADLGLYWEGGLARFNNVVTRVDARRRGACGTLVYEASQIVLNSGRCETLVLAAIADSAAARLYESLGFEVVQKLCRLEWTA